MKFEKENNSWVAVGKLGRFVITQKYRMWFAKYESEEKNFNLPRTRLLRQAKEMCKNNFYWED